MEKLRRCPPGTRLVQSCRKTSPASKRSPAKQRDLDEIREFLEKPYKLAAPKTTDPALDLVVRAFDLAPVVITEVHRALRVRMKSRTSKSTTGRKQRLETAYAAAMKKVLTPMRLGAGLERVLSVSVSIKRAVYSLLLTLER
jgi:hypothetical protein